jgi:hypothetical protein
MVFACREVYLMELLGPGRPRRTAALLRGRRLDDAAEPVPAVPAAAPGARHGPAHRPDVADASAPGRRRRAAGARGAPTPSRQVLVVNIGDTFAALTDGRHASCLHRAVVNSAAARRSLAFFLNPQMDCVVRPPPALLAADPARPRTYPDFTWREFLEFTQKGYRSDESTMNAFVSWIKGGRGGNENDLS